VEHVREKLDVSERRVCRVIDQPRSTQRYLPGVQEDEEGLCSEIAGWPVGMAGTGIAG
jgi:hypothetical protein